MAKKHLLENEAKTFPLRLSKLMGETKTTQQELASLLGVTRQAISGYCRGDSSPKWEGIVELCKFFSVTADYLLGLSDWETTETPYNSRMTREETARYMELQRSVIDKQLHASPFNSVSFVVDLLPGDSVKSLLSDMYETLPPSLRKEVALYAALLATQYHEDTKKEVDTNGIHTEEDHKDG